MSDRYYGSEEITSSSQVVRYLVDNYVDENEVPVTEDKAMRAVLDAHEDVHKAIDVFKSMVYYVGDQIAATQLGWTELDQDEDDEDEEEDDE